MRKLVVMLLLAVAVFALSACSSVPAKKDTPLATFNTLVVRPINWSETVTDKIDGDEAKEYAEAQPKLSGLFKAEFEKYIGKIGYFDQILFTTETAPKGALVLEPKIVTLDPGIRWVMAGTATYQGILTDADGKVVAKYSAKRIVSRPVYSSMIGAIETLTTELGEDAATGIPEAK
ncbi:hypothetical protein [Geobacter grbiciae]|uniref:hypothetical protein n=1 Tax=Geobacter grbiciae TaxID=155042 RepID=UPI001C01ABCE|nr:hypothetical protein [Geobacter grbiciae]MBT1074331.1 hypothetical protein [Geobacter grbiciae]